MKGVSFELWPLVRMTVPEGSDSLVEEPLTLGRPLFRSTLLLLGVLPVDRSDLTLIEVDVGRRFLERSPMATQRVWEHERTLEPTKQGTRIIDRLAWEGKNAALTQVYGLAVPLLFTWRHRRLRQLFGEATRAAT